MEAETEKVCRSCLKVDKQMKNIFEDTESRIPQMIKACTSIKVMPIDGLPDSLCSECEEKLTSAYNFREFFRNNDQALRAHLNVAVKTDKDEDEYSLYDADVTENDAQESEVNDSELDATDEKQKCAKCSKTFSTPRALRAHTTKMHGNDDPDYDPELYLSKNKVYNCSQCAMQFSRHHLLMKHQREMHLEVSLEENQSEIKVEMLDDEDEEDDEEEFEEDELMDDEEEGEKSVRKEFPCDFCKKVLTTAQGLKVHRRKHTGKNLYECSECDKSFSKCRNWKNHQKNAHGPGSQQNQAGTAKREMQCEFCERKFKYKKSFTQHMSSEHGIDVDEEDLIVEPIVKRKRRTVEEKDFSNSDSDSIVDDKKSKVHKCTVCAAEFARFNHLTRHMVLHRDMMTHKCDKCQFGFMSEEELKKHYTRHQDKPYACFACTKAFSRGEQYIRHVKTHDEPEEGKVLVCPICPENRETIGDLTEHVKVHLASDKSHTCSTCGKSFNRADNLRTHLKTHKGEAAVPKLHLCIYCGKEFNNSSNMIVHMRRHTGERPYKCKQCGKGFPRSHDLKCHERTHSGEKPYLCTLCGKSFNKSNKLLRHTRVHTGERPYVCSICTRAFTQSNDLALHMRRHTGARPYACGVCPARFIQSGQLKAHQRSKGHWVETTPDLKGSYRVEPVISTGESKPIRFRRTASGHKYEPPNFEANPPPLLEQQQNLQQKEVSQLQNLLTQDHATSADKKSTIVPVLNASSNVHLVQVQPSQTMAMEYSHSAQHGQAFAPAMVQVHPETIVVVPVHSHTPTSSAGTFQDDSVQGSENSSAFSPADGSYECRSYS